MDAEEIWGRSVTVLGETIDSAASLQAALNAVEQYVAAQVHRGKSPDPVVAEAVSSLMPWRTADVASVTASLFISETQMRRRIRGAVGLPPKTLHRMLRFQGFLALVQFGFAHGHAPTDTSLARLAVRAGYADQSHLSRECIRLTGVSPRVFVTETHTACAGGHDHSTSFALLRSGPQPTAY